MIDASEILTAYFARFNQQNYIFFSAIINNSLPALGAIEL